jgi:anti-sigma B factor antagonist
MEDVRIASDRGEIIFFAPKRITLGRGSVVLRSTIRSLAEGGFNRVVLDLGETSYVDSSGIGELVSAFTLIRNAGGALKLNRLEGKVKDLFEITKLYTVFDVRQNNYGHIPSVLINSNDISPLKAAAALPLVLSLQGSHIRVELGVQDGFYRVTPLGSPDENSFLLGSPHVFSDGRRTTYYETLQEFEDIINSASVAESEIHQFLERNPHILLGRDYRQLHSKLLLQREDDGPLIPDFFLQPFDNGLCDLVELKLPSAPVLVGNDNRKRFSSSVYAAIAQLRTYSNYFDDRSRREAIAVRYGLKVYRPKLAVVIGRLSNLDPIDYRRITDSEKDVQIVTYDDLLAKARRILVV